MSNFIHRSQHSLNFEVEESFNEDMTAFYYIFLSLLSMIDDIAGCIRLILTYPVHLILNALELMVVIRYQSYGWSGHTRGRVN